MDAEGTVFVVEDDPGVRRSLVELLEAVELRVKAYDRARAFLEEYEPDAPGVLLLDVRMPGMSGIDLQKKLLAEGAAIPIVIVTGHGDVRMAVDAVLRGAVDFIEKPFHPQHLLDCIQQALALDAENRRRRAEHDALAKRFACLTAREAQVIDLVVQGRSNKEIAAQLGVRPQTIDVQRSRAMEKLCAAHIPELVRIHDRFRGRLGTASIIAGSTGL